MRKLLVIPAALAVVLAAGAEPASASCVAPDPLEVRLARAPAVFVGTVVATRSRDRAATVRVEEVWKGPDLRRQVEVLGSELLGEGATSVDRTFRRGTRYLFVPEGGGAPERRRGVDTFQDNSCSATREYEPGLDRFRPASARGPVDATAGPATTDDGGRTLPERADGDGASARPGSSTGQPLVVALLLVAATAAVLGGTVTWRRR